MSQPTTNTAGRAEGVSVLLLIREPARLGPALTEWLAELTKLGRDYELVLLDGADQPLVLPAEYADHPGLSLVRPSPPLLPPPLPPPSPPPHAESPVAEAATPEASAPPHTEQPASEAAQPAAEAAAARQPPVAIPADPTEPVTTAQPLPVQTESGGRDEPGGQAEPPEQAVAVPYVPGVGDLVAAGIRASHLPLVLIVGDDYPYAPADAHRLLAAIEKAHPGLDRPVDLVNGCRPGYLGAEELARRHALWGWLLRVLLDYPSDPPKADLGQAAKRYAWWAWLMFGLRVLDVQSGYKLIRRSMLERFPLQSRGEFVFTEILAKVNFLVGQMDECLLSGPSGQVEIDLAALAADRKQLLERPIFRHDLLPA
jgi:hypothetical protein